MKLVDILARELREWPTNQPCLWISECHSATVYGRSGSHEVSFTGDWPCPEDYLTAIVYKADWQAAVDALKATTKVVVAECASSVKPWIGEGLPPAGTVCDHRTGHGMNWSQATILAHGEKKVFYRDRDGHEWTRLYDEIEFRPIRTPEQIIADREREERIKSAQVWLEGIAQAYGADTADKCEDILMEFENRKQEADK